MDHIQKIIQQAKKAKNVGRKRAHKSSNYATREYNLNASDNSVKPIENISYTQTRQLIIDEHEMAERKLVAGIKDDSRNTQIKILRTQVLHELNKNNWTTIAINSATQGAGKSFVASNLAVSIALEVNQTVILVDLDLRRPGLHKYFGIKPKAGLLNYLKDNVSVRELLINPGIERLVVLPGNGSTSEASELLSSPKMIDLVNEIKNRYESRIVIFDLPPLLAVDDARVILPYIDSSILVVEDGKNTEDEIKKSIEILSDTNFIGIVLNKSLENNINYTYKY